MNKIFFTIIILFLLGFALPVFAHQPRIVYFQTGSIQIANPEISQAFYDELKGSPRDYFINSDKDFELYLNLLVPNPENSSGRYSANVFLIDKDSEKLVLSLDGQSFQWKQFYEPFGRDWYMKGPELDQKVSAGKYKIEVFSKDNLGKYVLAVGKIESFDLPSLLNVYWQLPLLKMQFFKTSVLEFFFTPFGIGAAAFLGAVLILWAILYYLIGTIKMAIRHRQAKTLLLTSAGMQMKKEIIQLLQKPAYDITVGFIITAAKTQENLDYVNRDLEAMKEVGFNTEEIDIEGKTEAEVMKLLELKDIIWVEGGNTVYLLKAMRACKFGKVIRKLLKRGKVYVGSGEGSIVAGKKGLKLVPFDIFVHYLPEHAEIIKKKLPWKWQRKKLRILTDSQAILVQGKEIDLIGEGEKIVI